MKLENYVKNHAKEVKREKEKFSDKKEKINYNGEIINPMNGKVIYSRKPPTKIIINK